MHSVKKTQKKPTAAKKNAVKKATVKKTAKRTLTTKAFKIQQPHQSSHSSSPLQQHQQQHVAFTQSPLSQSQRTLFTAPSARAVTSSSSSSSSSTPALVTKKATTPFMTLAQTFSAFPVLKKSMLTTAMRHFHPGNERLRGVVKWFDAAKGFGFVTNPATGADLFVHFTSINTNGYRNLSEGQTVEYSIGSTSKGPAAVDVVPFERDQGAV